MSWVRVVVIGLVVQATLVLAFVLPAHDPQPRDLPIAAPAPAAGALQQRLGEVADVRPVSSPAEARALIADREVLGAVLDGQVLVATGASPATAQLLRSMASGPGGPGAQATGAQVRDLAPLAPGDSRGTTLGALILPVVIACLPFALLLWRSGLSRGRALGAALAFAALGGLSVAAIAQGVVDALPGPYLGLAAVVALAVAAIALPAAGAARLIGPAGFGVVAALVFLIGNPASGAANGPEFLPSPWRELSGLLPPGAAADAIRSVAWFDGAGVGPGLLVLTLWAAVGAAGLLASRPAPVTAPATAPAAVTAA